MTVAQSEAARAASINVIGRAPEEARLVGEVAERQVASVAQQSAVPTGRVAMVDVEPSQSVISTAQIARGCGDSERGLLGCKPVTPHYRGQVLLVGFSAVPTPISLSALFAVFRAVVAHPSILAVATRRLPHIVRDVVEAVVGQRPNYAAPAAHFFHSKFRSRISGFRRAENVL